MPSVNKVIVMGNLGKDPELRYTPSGTAVCNVSVATTRHWKSREGGERQEETEWHRVVFYDRLAEIAGEYLKKGRPVYVEGRLKTRKWQDKDGKDAYTTEIIAENLQLLGGRDDDGGGRRGENEAAAQQRNRGGDGRQRDAEGSYDRPRGQSHGDRPGGPKDMQRRQSQGQQQRSSGFDDMDDDIPF